MRNSTGKKRRTRRIKVASAAIVLTCTIIILAAAFCGRDKSNAVSETPTKTTEISEAPEEEMESSTEKFAESSAEPELISLGEFTITAYCPCVKCCGVWSAEYESNIGKDYVQKTSSGTIPEAGRTIGVDPDVIPYGTVVVIGGHEYIAEDSGAALSGNAVDIYFDTHEEAVNFGRQTAEVFIKNSVSE